jgi:dipeptidyl aminopeptidase/acylaminoacyl peptidase
MSGNVRSNDDTLVARRLAARFEARSTSREPEGLLDAAMARVATTRQRPRWLVSERWLPMTTLTLRVRPVIRTGWLLAILVVIVALLLALIVGGGRHGLPSNGRILFGQGGDIWQLNADGTTTDLTPDTTVETSIVWAADGRRAGFFSATSDGAQLALLEGNAPAKIVPTSVRFHPTFKDAEVMSWSPDGNRVVFGSTPSGDPTPGPSRLWIVNVDTGQTNQLPLGDLVAADTPTWSRDGSTIAFRGQVDELPNPTHALYTITPTGSGLTRLTPTLADQYDAVAIGPPVWSMDGSTIYFDAANTLGQDTRFRLYSVNVRTHIVTQLRTDPANPYAVSLSPDGAWLAFTNWDGPTETSSLWVMHPDGTGQRQLADHSVSMSDQWSPDGQWILYEGQPIAGHDNSLYEIHPDGSGLKVLLNAPSPSSGNPRAGLSWQAVP